MKKSIIIFSALLFTLKTFAQDTEAQAPAPAAPDLHHVELGFRFMPTVSSIKMQTSSGGTVQGEATFGYGIGAMLALNINNHIGVQGEIIYNALSQKYRDQDLERTVHVDYINIPLLFAINTGKSNAVNLNFVVGPQLGYNVGSRIETAGPNSNVDSLSATVITKKGDLGFCYGADLGFALNQSRTLRLDLGFRGVFGFVNIQSNVNPNTRSFNVIAHSNLQTYSGLAGIAFLF